MTRDRMILEAKLIAATLGILLLTSGGIVLAAALCGIRFS